MSTSALAASGAGPSTCHEDDLAGRRLVLHLDAEVGDHAAHRRDRRERRVLDP
jgi:hypothetical protein